MAVIPVGSVGGATDNSYIGVKLPKQTAGPTDTTITSADPIGAFPRFSHTPAFPPLSVEIPPR